VLIESSAIRSKSQPRPCVLSEKFSTNKLIGGSWFDRDRVATATIYLRFVVHRTYYTAAVPIQFSPCWRAATDSLDPLGVEVLSNSMRRAS